MPVWQFVNGYGLPYGRIYLEKCLSLSENEGKEKECIPWQRETTVHIIKVHNRIREVKRLPAVRHQRQGRRRKQDLRKRLDRRPLPVQGEERRRHSLHRSRHGRMKFTCSSIWQYARFSSSAILAGVEWLVISLPDLCSGYLALRNIFFRCMYSLHLLFCCQMARKRQL